MHTSFFWTVFPYLLLASIVGFGVGFLVRSAPRRKIGDTRTGGDTRELESKVEAIRFQLESLETSVERLAMLDELLQRVSLLDEHQKERAGALDRRLNALDDLSQKLSGVKEAGTRLGNIQTLLSRVEDQLRTGSPGSNKDK